MASMDSRKRAVVLGAVFGGLELTTLLSEAFGEGIEITLIDKADSFVFGFSKLDMMYDRRLPAEIHPPLTAIS